MAALENLNPKENLVNRANVHRSPNMLYRLGAVVLAGLVIGGTVEQFKHSRVEQTEIVQPYDTDWTVVTRAEKDAGINRNSVDIRPAVERVTEQYGTVLQPGEKVKVELDK